MPELPEVETIAREVRSKVQSRTVLMADLRRSDYLRGGASNLASIVGKSVAEVGRIGKRMFIRFGDQSGLMIHLGMSGRATFEPFESDLPAHTHLRIRFSGLALEFRLRDPRRFGGVWYIDHSPPAPGEAVCDNRDAGAAVGRLSMELGPDALSLKLPVFRALCRRRRQVKALLMDQRAISGLGNIYCDEALFEAGIHPLRLCSSLNDNEVKTLCVAIRSTLRKAIAFGGSTLRDYVRADGREGEFQKIHRVYGREGEACVRCKASIVRRQIAGRSTHFCLACQPASFPESLRRERRPAKAGRSGEPGPVASGRRPRRSK